MCNQTLFYFPAVSSVAGELHRSHLVSCEPNMVLRQVLLILKEICMVKILYDLQFVRHSCQPSFPDIFRGLITDLNRLRRTSHARTWSGFSAINLMCMCFFPFIILLSSLCLIRHVSHFLFSLSGSQSHFRDQLDQTRDQRDHAQDQRDQITRIIGIKAVISGCNMLIPLFIMNIAGINGIKMLLIDQQHDDPVDPCHGQAPETLYLCAVPAF